MRIRSPQLIHQRLRRSKIFQKSILEALISLSLSFVFSSPSLGSHSWKAVLGLLNSTSVQRMYAFLINALVGSVGPSPIIDKGGLEARSSLCGEPGDSLSSLDSPWRKISSARPLQSQPQLCLRSRKTIFD